MRKKLNLVVLMGGKSAEYEVSLSSGREVLKHLDPQKYHLFPVVISRDGLRWQLVNKQEFLDSPTGGERDQESGIKNQRSGSLRSWRQNFLTDRGVGRVDLVFISLHGPYGEDGTIQGMLETLGLPYTGSGVLASALGMNKVASRRLWRAAGLLVPRFVVVKEKNELLKVLKKFSYPLVIKPIAQGSSLGVSLVRQKDQIDLAFKKAAAFGGEVLGEEYIPGKEITCGILGNENPFALPLVEICPKHEFFDYQCKYDPAFCEEIVPAQIPKKISKKMQKIACRAYKILGCRGFGRLDLIFGNDGKIYLLELNSIPGLTANSLLPKAARAAGLSFSQLLDKIIELALEKN